MPRVCVLLFTEVTHLIEAVDETFRYVYLRCSFDDTVEQRMRPGNGLSEQEAPCPGKWF